MNGHAQANETAKRNGVLNDVTAVFFHQFYHFVWN